ncbi:putative acyltransferase [Halobacteroides halobius DSM 5150]|uniref:Putative acyltransferase n=1 Tax=Halobacteroides halobius (strain ATCC 35273 / DSM 5150 / MD-1) TaxID=748449 RepID=L0KDP0_HALHC|nr:GNAT family N-acetyltransferase [Halobacteroides halobius]AGB42489.1 putative acyltransferase [Halobacteroides halobius DSM 5150]
MKVKVINSEGDLDRALNLRKEVFVAEQGVPLDLEVDGNDQEAIHFIVENNGQLIGTCRLMKSNSQVAKLERMAIKSKYRKQGVGSKLITEVIDFAQSNNFKKLILHSQLQAKEFYLKHDFEIASNQVIKEAGIDHFKMKMEL